MRLSSAEPSNQEIALYFTVRDYTYVNNVYMVVVEYRGSQYIIEVYDLDPSYIVETFRQKYKDLMRKRLIIYNLNESIVKVVGGSV